MAPSRTFREQAASSGAEAGRGSAMDFSTGSQVPERRRAIAATGSKRVHAPRFDVKTDTTRDDLLTDFGKDTLRDRYLLPGRELPGPVRPRRLGLCRRRRARPAALRLHLEALVHAGDAGAVERRHRPRPADQLLPQQRLRQPRRHRRHLERECLAGVPGRRHRHLLGPGPRHRRAGRPQRQDQRHHPVRARDGLPDAGDQPGLAAPRLGRLLSRHLAPGDRGVPRDPQALGRLQPQGAEPPPRRARHRRVHGGGARRRRVGACSSPKDRSASAARSTPARCSRSWSRPGSRPASPTSSSSTR